MSAIGRKYDIHDIELCKQAPRSWSMLELEFFGRAEWWVRFKKQWPSNVQLCIHQHIKRAREAYRVEGKPVPWDNEYRRLLRPAPPPECDVFVPEPVPEPEVPPPPPEPEIVIPPGTIGKKHEEAARSVIRWLRPGKLQVYKLVKALEPTMNETLARVLISDMLKAGLIVRPDKGWYALPEPGVVVPAVEGADAD